MCTCVKEKEDLFVLVQVVGLKLVGLGAVLMGVG